MVRAAFAGRQLSAPCAPRRLECMSPFTALETAKRLDAVSLEQVIAVYDKQLGATTGELAIVGDFDPEPTLTQIREILKDWKRRKVKG